MLDEILPQKLEALEIPTKEHYGVLLSLLEGLNEPGSNGFELLFGRLKLIVLLQV